MALKLFILNNGREVIGKEKLHPMDGMTTKLRIEAPRILHFSPTAAGDAYGIELFPYSMTNPDGFHTFGEHAIASVSETIPEDVEKGYIQQTSGISIVTSLRG